MTFDCFDCCRAKQHKGEWPFFEADCPGCLARALAGIKTLPPLEPAPPEPQQEKK